MSYKRLLVAGILIFLIGVIVMFPARVAYNWFAPSGVEVSGIEGSVWRGSATAASVSNVYLRDLTWTIKPLRLLAGRFAYEIGASPAGGFLSTEAGVGFGGALHVSNLRGSLPLALFQGATGASGLSGTVNADIARLKIADGVPVTADGSLEVASLVLPMVMPSPLGSFRADLATQEDGVAASVQDMQAVIDIAGRLLLKPERDYEFLGRVTPTAETPEQLRRQLRFLGTPNEQGEYELRLAGRL